MVASEPMAMQPAIARQNRRGVWLYNPLPATASQISSKEATERAAHSKRSTQGTEVTIVTEYIPFRYFTRTASRYRRKCVNQFNHGVLWRGTTQNQDSRGIRPRGVNRIYQAQGEPWTSEARHVHYYTKLSESTYMSIETQWRVYIYIYIYIYIY